MSKSPPDWQPYEVRDLVSAHMSGLSPDCEERHIISAEEWGVLKTTAITWRGWDPLAHKVLPRAYWGLKHLAVERDDVLVTKAGPRHRVAVACHVNTVPERLLVSGKMIGLRPRKELVFPQVLAGIIAQPTVQKYIHDRTTGMAESQVNFANSALLSAQISLPSLPEQSKIAEILDTLDAAIRGTEVVVAKLKAMKHGLLHDLLTRGIDANGDLRPSKPEAPDLYKKTQLGWLPKHWSQPTLEDVTATSICYGIVQVFNFVDDGVPVLAIRDLLGDYQTGIHRTARHIDAQYPRSRVKPGDVLLSIKGTIGRVGVVPEHFTGNISRDIGLLRPNNLVNSIYLSLLLRSNLGQRLLADTQVGTTRAELSIAPLKRLRIPLPPMEEQISIADRVVSVDERLREETEMLSKLRLQKSGLMDDLLTGETPVTALL